MQGLHDKQPGDFPATLCPAHVAQRGMPAHVRQSRLHL